VPQVVADLRMNLNKRAPALTVVVPPGTPQRPGQVRAQGSDDIPLPAEAEPIRRGEPNEIIIDDLPAPVETGHIEIRSQVRGSTASKPATTTTSRPRSSATPRSTSSNLPVPLPEPPEGGR
jgi:hypothetical protein